MVSPQSKPIRVIQWATGPVGRSALRHILLNPDYELVGVLAYSEEKNGIDAASLVGLPDSGILVSTDRDAICALDADVVVYTPRMPLQTADMDADILPLLRAGKNIVTPAGYWYPHLYGADYVNTLTEACQAGGSAIFGAGDNPGFFFARLGMAATAACSEINSIKLIEFIDGELMSPSMVFDICLFGCRPEEMGSKFNFTDMLDHCYQEDMAMIGMQLGAEIDGFEKTARLGVLDHDLVIDMGTFKAGTVVAQQYCWKAMSRGVEVLSISNTWSVTRDVPGWQIDDQHWVVKIDGRPNLSIDVHASTSFDEVPLAKYLDTDTTGKDAITAMTVVNAIPRVCAHAPGIVYPDTGNLPKVQWGHLRR